MEGMKRGGIGEWRSGGVEEEWKWQSANDLKDWRIHCG